MKPTMPSIKTLARIYPRDAKQIRAILEEWDDTRTRYEHPSFQAAELLERISVIVGEDGAGEFADESGRTRVQYVNTGDPYTKTLIYCGDRWSGRFFVGGWDDIAECRA
jgi:hypothetical protein